MASVHTAIRLFTATLLLIAVLSCSAFTREGNKAGASPENLEPEQQWRHGWARGAVFYEIFVRSFQDSNSDGIGDINGLISKLDYLNDGNPQTSSDLGIDGIWLMPVFQSPSYHGYDTLNYRLINPQYGTNEDFIRLCGEAHKRGIKIIVDLVMNHASSEHPWFVEASSSPSSSKRNWFVWRNDNPGWTQPWGGNSPVWHQKNGSYYYGVFWSGMPDLNFRNAAVRKMYKDTAIHWLQRGVDGYRLDATRHLIETGPGPGQSDTPETHAYLKEFSAHIRKLKPEAMLVGENWTETQIIATYYGSTSKVTWGDELPMNFNFPISDAIISGLNSGTADGIAAKLTEIKTLYPPGVNDTPFLTNHDNVRLATQLQNRPPLLRSAASILLTLPGSPFLYYGEEAGIRNGTTSGDESKRTPMPWNDEPGGGFTTASTPWFPFSPGRQTANVSIQLSDPNSLLSHYKNLIGLRKRVDALKNGDIQILTAANSKTPVLAFLRKTAGEQVLVAHNLGGNFTVGGPYTITAISAERLFSDKVYTDPSGSSGQWTIPLPPHSTGIWKMR